MTSTGKRPERGESALNPSIEPPEYQTKSGIVAEEIRRRITSGELAPDTSLRQRDIAKQFNVSPTPVREAFTRLEAEGYLITEPHKGATVVRTESSRLWENAHIRAVLESLATRLAAPNLTDTDMEEIEGLADRFRRLTPETPIHSAVNRELHFRIYEAAHSPVLMRLLTIMWASLPEGPDVYRAHDESVAQHDAIVDALRRGDGAAAEELTREHILGSAKEMRKRLEGGDTEQSVDL